MPINIDWKSPRVATITALLAISIIGISLGIVVSK
ncbi:unnamed protein product, partial [marine sediment metagenome]